jgi:hypothetical protein
MSIRNKLAIAMAIISLPFIVYSLTREKQKPQDHILPADKNSFQFASNVSGPQQKIQVAVLLDVSNSMDGLIDQARAQLWNMVSVLGRTECANGTPLIEISLYEYGRSTNSERNGYVKQVNAFTGDLDEVSKNLYSLSTDGGDEYCGQVIYTSLQELDWDSASNNYKVIFIAGNEDFLQGSLHFKKACAEAQKKGVIVNTIYCGSRQDAIRENWNLGAECGRGSFTVIDQDANEEEIPTPYDSELLTLNTSLNNTYIGYGATGADRKSKLEDVDQMNLSMKTSVAVKRVAVKGNKKTYKNAEWDLVDAYAADSAVITKLPAQSLHDTLKNKSRTEVTGIVKQKLAERDKIQEKITALSKARDAFVAAEKKKKAGANINTLESEIEKILKEQVRRFNMNIP